MDKFEKKLNEIYQFVIDDFNNNDLGLLFGKAGSILFVANYEKYYSQKSNFDYINVFDNIIESIDNSTPSTFCDGIAGIAWSLLYCNENEITDLDAEDILYEIDVYLANALDVFLEQNHYDYLHGATGLILYFLKRNNNFASIQVEKYFTFIKEKAIIDNVSNCLFWESFEEDKSNINISLSHGTSSIISVLHKIWKIYPEIKDVEKFRDWGINYILSQKNNVDIGSVYPYCNKNDLQLKSRLAWCYGDMGIAFNQLIIAKETNNQILYNDAFNSLIFSSQRLNVEETGVNDAGLCHGGGGLAYMFSKLYNQYQKNENFKIAFEFWYNDTIEKSIYSDGFAGFKAFAPLSEEKYMPEYGLLEGVSGIGMALLYKIRPDMCTKWDECLLLS